MKKVSLQTILDTLTSIDFDNEILDEIRAELTKGDARKAATAQGYEDAHDVIVGALTNTPATVAEIYDAVKNDLPDGFGKGKVQYALTHLWQDEIVKVEGKPNGYRKA